MHMNWWSVIIVVYKDFCAEGSRVAMCIAIITNTFITIPAIRMDFGGMNSFTITPHLALWM